MLYFCPKAWTMANKKEDTFCIISSEIDGIVRVFNPTPSKLYICVIEEKLKEGELERILNFIDKNKYAKLLFYYKN